MAFVRCKRSVQWNDVFSCTFQEWFINVMKMDLSYNSEPQKASAKDASFFLTLHISDLVGLVAFWVSSNFHSNFSPIFIPCGAIICPYLT